MSVNSVVSIEIGLIYTKVCEVDYQKKNTRVSKAFIFETPENTIEDGYIRDKQTFGDELKRQLEDHKVRNKNVLFTISSNKILSREVTIPEVKEKKIMDIVKVQANDYFPMDITEHILTYTLLGPAPEPKQLRLLVFAAPSTLIRNYYNLAELLGVNLVALDYIGNSSYQILKRIPGDNVNFVIQLNQQNTLVSILQGNDLLMQRSVNFGVASLVDLMKGYEEFSEKSTNDCFSCLCTETLLRRSFEQKKDAASAERTYEESRHEEMVDELMEEMRLFNNNINRVIEYYNAKEPTRKIGKVYLLGKGARIKGLGRLLANETNFEVELLNSVHSVYFKKSAAAQQKDELFSCIGAALKPVNFVPDELQQKSQKQMNTRFYLLISVLALVGCGAMMWAAYSDYQGALKEQEELTKKRDGYLYIEPKYAAWTKSQKALEEAEKIVGMTFHYNDQLLPMILELEEKLPANSIVQSFSATEEDILISFVTDSKETAAAILVSLRQIPYFDNISIAGITESGDEILVSFSVNLKWTVPEPLPEEVAEDEK